MRALQKLVRNGNSTQFTIPRAILIHLNWVAGETMMLEVREDGSMLLRRPRESDFGAQLHHRRGEFSAEDVK